MLRAQLQTRARLGSLKQLWACPRVTRPLRPPLSVHCLPTSKLRRPTPPVCRDFSLLLPLNEVLCPHRLLWHREGCFDALRLAEAWTHLRLSPDRLWLRPAESLPSPSSRSICSPLRPPPHYPRPLASFLSCRCEWVQCEEHGCGRRSPPSPLPSVRRWWCPRPRPPRCHPPGRT